VCVILLLVVLGSGLVLRVIRPAGQVTAGGAGGGGCSERLCMRLFQPPVYRIE
jgi:hypothetical protein